VILSLLTNILSGVTSQFSKGPKLNITHYSPKIHIETENSSIHEIDDQISITVFVQKVERYHVFLNGTYQVDIEGTDYPLFENRICAVNFFGSEEKTERDNLLSKIENGSVWHITGPYFVDPDDSEIRIFPEYYVPVDPLHDEDTV